MKVRANMRKSDAQRRRYDKKKEKNNASSVAQTYTEEPHHSAFQGTSLIYALLP